MPSTPSSRRLRSLVSWLAHAHPQSRTQSAPPPPSQQGLTLIECLVAMIVITVTVVAITPPIMLATATRVQSRRAEQATAIAQGEIDRVRLLVERSDKDVKYKKSNLPDYYTGAIKDAPVATAVDTDRIISSTVTPSSNPTTACGTDLYPTSTQLSGTQLVRVDVDGDCKPDYIMQVFRAEDQFPVGVTPTDPDVSPFAFKVGVRVYSYFPGETLPALGKTRSSMVSTTGARDNSIGGKDERKPLAVLYTSISRSGSSSTLCQVRQQIKKSTEGVDDSCVSPSPSPSPSTPP
jgi:prepilin-type N-terminal cleavage/methylation domain-containing protein